MISFNEINCITESVIFNEKDIYYNKDKFDSGEINLCFITGHSGSGKSTMGLDATKGNEDKVDTYSLDDLQWSWKFSDDNLKEYGDLIYSFFNSIGKKYRIPYRIEKNGKLRGLTGDDVNKWYNDNGFKSLTDYVDKACNTFVDYAIRYTKSNKNKKYIIEGIQLFLFINPSKLKDYAVYIKGTSALISTLRGVKRDSLGPTHIIDNIDMFYRRIKDTIGINGFEAKISQYRKYFSNLMTEKEVTESFMSAYKNNMILYHLSETNLDGKVLKPRIPSNFLVDNGYEDNTTKRVCFSNSISGALAAMSKNIEGKEFYVYSPIDSVEAKVPSNKEVPDVNITKERWVLSDVKIKCIGKIKVGTAKDKPFRYKYGNKTAELYYWNYEWIKT